MLTDFGIWLFVDMLLSVLNQCSSVAKFIWLRPKAALCESVAHNLPT